MSRSSSDNCTSLFSSSSKSPEVDARSLSNASASNFSSKVSPFAKAMAALLESPSKSLSSSLSSAFLVTAPRKFVAYSFDHPDIPPRPSPPPPPLDDADFRLDPDATPPRLFEALMLKSSFALEDERSKCPRTESEDAVQTMATEPAIKHPPTNREYDVDEVIVADVFNPSC